MASENGKQGAIARRSYKNDSDHESFLGSMGVQETNGKAFNWRVANIHVVTHLLQAAADASAMISFGHNRSGTANINLFVEGKRDTVTVHSDSDFILCSETIIDALNAYTKSKGWQLTPIPKTK